MCVFGVRIIPEAQQARADAPRPLYPLGVRLSKPFCDGGRLIGAVSASRRGVMVVGGGGQASASSNWN